MSETRGIASLIRWNLMPWWAYAWRYRHDDADWHPAAWRRCIGSTTLWLDEILKRLPGGHLFEPIPHIECNCDYCRGVPGATYEP